MSETREFYFEVRGKSLAENIERAVEFRAGYKSLTAAKAAASKVLDSLFWSGLSAYAYAYAGECTDSQGLVALAKKPDRFATWGKLREW